MLRRVTTRDIARAAGLHPSTVSRALRNHPGIPAATCDRVREIAAKLGYTPDPMLASLNAYRRSAHPVAYQATLAWVTNASTRHGWSSNRTIALFHEGARDRAREFGYKLEIFWLREPGMSLPRTMQVLKTRGIQGLLLAPQPQPGTRLELDWSEFSAVSFGYTLVFPPLHMVTANHFRAAGAMLRNLHARGYRRVGLALSATTDEQVDHAWIGGYLVEQQLLFPGAKIPPFVKEVTAANEPAFWAWYKRYCPEVIVAHDRTFLQFLRKRGLNVPHDVGMAFFHLAEDAGREAGIFEHPLTVGAAAADLLIAMLNRNEKGIPETQQRILIEGVWRDGPTILPRPAAKPAVRRD